MSHMYDSPTSLMNSIRSIVSEDKMSLDAESAAAYKDTTIGKTFVALEATADFNRAAAQAAIKGQEEFEFPPGSGKMYKSEMGIEDAKKIIASDNASKGEDDYPDEEPKEMKKKKVEVDVNPVMEQEEMPDYEVIDYEEDDDEGEMGLNQLQICIDAIERLTNILETEEDIPEWVQSKITLATNYLDTAADYMSAIKTKNFAEQAENEEYIVERTDYNIYHKTYSSAVQHALDNVEKMGYEVDMEDYERKVAFGPKKPSVGNTNSFSIRLMKNGKPVKKALQMQVYGMDSGNYELNMYVEESNVKNEELEEATKPNASTPEEVKAALEKVLGKKLEMKRKAFDDLKRVTFELSDKTSAVFNPISNLIDVYVSGKNKDTFRGIDDSIAKKIKSYVKEGTQQVYTVDYSVFNQPMKTRRFKSYKDAKKFYDSVRNDRRVKRAEMTGEPPMEEYVKEGGKQVYTVDYSVFNQPMKTRRFKSYKEAKKFYDLVRNDRRVKRAEMTGEPPIEEKAYSPQQQRFFALALMVRRGEMKRSDVSQEVLDVVDSKMTDKEIRDFAATKHDQLRKPKSESVLMNLMNMRKKLVEANELASESELIAYIENNEKIFKEVTSVMDKISNLSGGTSDVAKATKLWMPVVDKACKMYEQEYGDNSGAKITDKTKKSVATKLATKSIDFS